MITSLLSVCTSLISELCSRKRWRKCRNGHSGRCFMIFSAVMFLPSVIFSNQIFCWATAEHMPWSNRLYEISALAWNAQHQDYKYLKLRLNFEGTTLLTKFIFPRNKFTCLKLGLLTPKHITTAQPITISIKTFKFLFCISSNFFLNLNEPAAINAFDNNMMLNEGFRNKSRWLVNKTEISNECKFYG